MLFDVRAVPAQRSVRIGDERRVASIVFRCKNMPGLAIYELANNPRHLVCFLARHGRDFLFPTEIV